MPTNGTLKPGDPGYIAPNTGLLQTATPDKSVIGYTPATATVDKPTAVGYTPETFKVDAPQTVKGQINNIIADDSPLMQQAEARSRAAMNAKGLLNSSIAVGAGHAAVVDRALPIAQQDAKTYETANINSINALNAANAFKAGAENTATLRGSELGTNVNLANAEAANTSMRETSAQANQILNTKLTTENQMAMAQLDAATKTSLTTMDNQYRQLLQTNQSAQGMVNQAIQNIASIAMSNTMSAAAKKSATATQLNLLNEGLKTMAGTASTLPEAVTNLDLSQYFVDVSGSTASNNTAALESKVKSLEKQLADEKAKAKNTQPNPGSWWPNVPTMRPPAR